MVSFPGTATFSAHPGGVYSEEWFPGVASIYTFEGLKTP